MAISNDQLRCRLERHQVVDQADREHRGRAHEQDRQSGDADDDQMQAEDGNGNADAAEQRGRTSMPPIGARRGDKAVPPREGAAQQHEHRRDREGDTGIGKQLNHEL